MRFRDQCLTLGRLVLIGVCSCAVPFSASAQPSAQASASGPTSSASEAPANPMTAGIGRLSGFVKLNIIKSADRMSEENYAFRPTPEVRSFGEMLGHIANSNYSFCSQASATANPSKTNVEKTVTAKADLVLALQQSFAYCDGVLAAMTDRTGGALVKFPGGDLSKLSVLTLNTAHNFEHYGNLITYLRIKGLVPPSSDPK
jgi:uncharacterized damage-inducible protein DinB